MFTQVIQVLLSFTILTALAEPISTQKSEVENLTDSTTAKFYENISDNAFKSEDGIKNGNNYYNNFYQYSTEETTKPTVVEESTEIQNEGNDSKSKLDQEPNNEESEKENSSEEKGSSEEENSSEEELLEMSDRNPKEISDNEENLITDQSSYEFSNNREVYTNNKNFDYDDVLLEIQNLGEFGSKIFPKPMDDKITTEKRHQSKKQVIKKNFRKKTKPSKLIEKTKDIISGIDVLNINEAFVKDYKEDYLNPKIELSVLREPEDVSEVKKTEISNGNDNNSDQTFTASRFVEINNNDFYDENRLRENSLSLPTFENELINDGTKLPEDVPERRVTNLSKHPIVVADIETTHTTETYTPTVSQNFVENLGNSPNSQPLEIKGEDYAVADALKGNFTDHKLSGFKDTKSKTVVEIQKSVPIYLGSFTKFVFDKPEKTFEHKVPNDNQTFQTNPSLETNLPQQNLAYEIYPDYETTQNKNNVTETKLPPQNFPYQFEVITPSPPPSTNTYQEGSNYTEQYVLLPLDDSVNSQIEPIRTPSKISANFVLPSDVSLNVSYAEPKPAQYNYEYNQQNTEYNVRSQPQYVTYSLHAAVPSQKDSNKLAIYQEAPRPIRVDSPPAYENSFVSLLPPVQVSLNSQQYAEPVKNFHPPPVNIPALGHPYFPALASNVKPDDVKVLPILPLEFFQLPHPGFSQNKSPKRGRYEQPKFHQGNFRKTRVKSSSFSSPTVQPAPPQFVKFQQQPQQQPKQHGNDYVHLKSFRYPDLDVSNSEHFNKNSKSRHARHNFDNVRMEYGFMPPLIPSLQIDEFGRPIEQSS